MPVTVFRHLILISIDFYDFISSFLKIEMINKKLKTVFNHIFKHQEVSGKYDELRSIFNELAYLIYLLNRNENEGENEEKYLCKVRSDKQTQPNSSLTLFKLDELLMSLRNITSSKFVQNDW